MTEPVDQCVTPIETSGRDELILPRPKRRRRAAREDRGLPSDADIRQLAQEYLRVQTKLWPELHEATLLPKESEVVLDAMVADFKKRHRFGHTQPSNVAELAKQKIRIAGIYVRYSSANSNATSNVDQMFNALQKAKAENYFVPWWALFGDYAVTGMWAGRQGYTMYKQVLTTDSHRLEATFIDDFTRASREEIEWWRLAKISRRMNKKLLGASDGFNLHSDGWDIQLTCYALFSRLLMKGYREKNLRGMKGASRRGTCLGKLPLGFTRRILLDTSGRPIVNHEGKAKCEPWIDPSTSDWALKMFQLYVDERWSEKRIARHFNENRVDGWNGWTEGTIKKAVRNPAYIGVFIFNKHRNERDTESGRITKTVNPHADWVVHYNPEKRIVSMEYWRKARRRAAEARRVSPLTGRDPSRNEKYPSTLFSGILQCGYCNHSEIKLVHSDHKYQSMGCLNGGMRGNDCRLVTSKSVRIIENKLLTFIFDQLITSTMLSMLVDDANRHLQELAKRPKADVQHLRKHADSIKRKIDRLMNLIVGADKESAVEYYDAKIKELSREHANAVQAFRAVEKQNAPPPPPLDLKRIKAYLGDPRSLLNQSTAAVSHVLASLTGPIKITQRAIPGKKRGAAWVATFSPKFVNFLRNVSSRADSPDCITLEFLKERIWRNTPAVEVVIEECHSYEQHSVEVKRLVDSGTSLAAISAQLKITYEMATNSLHFAQTGQRPKWPKKPKVSDPNRRRKEIYKEIASKVARLKDKKKLSFERIAQDNGWGVATVRRAYYHAHPELTQEAVEAGTNRKATSYTHLGDAVFRRIRKLAAAGWTVKDIARKVRCGESSVRREIKLMNGKKSVA